MNYVIVFKRRGELLCLLFVGRDESEVAYKYSTLIRNEDDVIKAMLEFFSPDNGDMIIQETLLDSKAFKEEESKFLELQRYL